MTVLLTLLACGTTPAPSAAPRAPSSSAEKTSETKELRGQPKTERVVPDDWKKVEKNGRVPLADRPPPTGPTGQALLDAVQGKTYTTNGMTFSFADKLSTLTWPQMKGEPLVSELGVQDDLMVIEIGDQPNTLNQRFLVEGTSKCTITLVHRVQRGLGEAAIDIPLQQVSPDCAE